MWIKKFHRDQIEDKRSPIPTQVVSNEEFLPTPQTKQQKEGTNETELTMKNKVLKTFGSDGRGVPS